MFFSRYESTLGTMELYACKLLSSDTDANICREKLEIDSLKLTIFLPRHPSACQKILMVKQHLDTRHFHIYAVVGKNLGCIRPFN